MINIINDDCINVMIEYEDQYFDLAIVDPPYGIGLDFQFKNGLGPSIHKQKNWNDNIPNKKYFDELYRVSKHQIIWGCNYFNKYINSVGRIIHDKEMVQEGTKLRFSEADIASCSLQKRITMFRYRWNGNVQGDTINWKNEGSDRRIHPTQKPIKLYDWLLKYYAKTDYKIIDTHLGSASSAIAAHRFNIKEFVGIEIDEDYYNNAMDRINVFTNQIELFYD